MKFSSVLFMVCGVSLTAQAQLRCEEVFPKTTLLQLVPAKSAFAANTVEIFFTHKGRQMYYRIDQPAHGSEVTVVLHGLGDHAGRLNKLADDLLAHGERVIRIDLHGHGRTLNRNLELGHSVDEAVPFETQVEDVTALLQSLKLTSFKLVGHSYGGGVAAAVAARISPFSVKTSPIRRLVLLAPLVMDLRKYYSSGFLAVESFRDFQLVQLKNMPGSQSFLGLEASFTRSYFSGVEGWIAASRRLSQFAGPEAFGFDGQMDRATEWMMGKSYRPYFEEIAKGEGLAGQPNIAVTLDMEVTSSIRVTQGIGEYSFFDPAHAFWSSSIETLLVAGTDDKLVPMDLLKKTELHLRSVGVPVQFVEVESGHLIPQTIPDQVTSLTLGKKPN